jgi:hypothetical protein
MAQAITITIFIILAHFAALSSLALTTGVFAESPFLVPKEVFLSRSHKVGMLSAASSALILIGTGLTGLIDYGIIPGVVLLLVDTYLIYRAVTEYRR